jgi:HK97 family phage portal protein
MGLRSLVGRRSSEPERRSGSWDQYVRTVLTGDGAQSGPSMDKVLRNAASFACINVLVDVVARTPFDAIDTTGGKRTPITPEPQIVSDPSGIVDDDVWRGQLAGSLLTDGNAFGEIVDTGARGLPTQIEWVDSSTVTNRRLEDGWPTVSLATGGRETTEFLWPKGRIFHVPGKLVLAGSWAAVSPALYANRTIGTSLSVQDYSARFFDGGGHPTAIVKSDEDLDDEQSQQIKDRISRFLSKPTREPLVMGSGLDYETIQTPPSETQFIELLRFEVEQACRFWGVPPSMVYLAMSGQSVTYQNITDADLMLLKYSIDGYLVRIEKRWSRCLPDRQIVKANRDAVLRPDVTKRMATHKAALECGLESVNEGRVIEDKEPWTDPMYDLPGLPASLAPTPKGGN